MTEWSIPWFSVLACLVRIRETRGYRGCVGVLAYEECLLFVGCRAGEFRRNVGDALALRKYLTKFTKPNW